MMQTPIKEYRSNKRQTQWDRLLIEGWRADWKVGRLIKAFVAGTEHEWATDILGVLRPIKRAPRIVHDLQSPVRVFVASRLRPLSEMMWDNNRSDQYVLEYLKCRRLDTEIWVKSAIAKTPRSRSAARYMPARDGDKRHDWKTVK